MQNTILENLTITGLFGSRDVRVTFPENCRILIGENGTGKTTIMMILNSVLSGNIENLRKLPFQKIELKTPEGQVFIFSQTDIDSYIRGKREITSDLDQSILEKLIHQILKKGLNFFNSEFDVFAFIQQSSLKATIESNLFNTSIHNEVWNWMNASQEIFSWLEYISQLELEVLYLPTYRRIETDLTSLLTEVPPPQETRDPWGRVPGTGYIRHTSSLSKYEEDDIIRRRLANHSHIHFGMSDIIRKIDSLLKSIQSSSIRGFSEVSAETIKYLISNRRLEASPVFKRGEVAIILQRVGDGLSGEEKEQILQMVDEHKISENPYLEMFLESLLKVYRSQEEFDMALKRFAESCNLFLRDKEFVYDESRITLKLYFRKDKQRENPLSFTTLSSGEKQLVSIMAQCQLKIKGNLVVLVDEPELSLSIMWQRKLLPTILKAPTCGLLVAVTHSPFIFDNELAPFAQGAGEYIINRE